MKEIKAVNFQIPSQNDNYIKIDSFHSLSDADIVVFSSDLSSTSFDDFLYSGAETFHGKKLFDKESSMQLMEYIKYWRKELLYFVQRGGTLFVPLVKKRAFFLHTGEKETSGTGRNQKVTEIVNEHSNYDFFPFAGVEYNVAFGKTVVPQSPLVIDLFKRFEKSYSFEMYIDGSSVIDKIFTTKKNDRTLGAVITFGKGHVIYLPSIDLGIDNQRTYSKKQGYKWNPEALTTGRVFMDCLAQIELALTTKNAKTPKPSWIQNESFKLLKSIDTLNKINKIKEDIGVLEKDIEELNIIFQEQELLKDLLFESGKALEVAVTKALHILGYSAENFDNGNLELDQVIISPEGHRLIGECEGKDNKDIDVSKFRQLLDSLNADFQREDVSEKAWGLLIGNPQRLTEPSKRTLDFTDKCKSGAKREKIGLINTVDLFNACRYIIESNDLGYASSCRASIIDQLGEVIKFPSIPEVKSNEPKF